MAGTSYSVAWVPAANTWAGQGARQVGGPERIMSPSVLGRGVSTSEHGRSDIATNGGARDHTSDPPPTIFADAARGCSKWGPFRPGLGAAQLYAGRDTLHRAAFALELIASHTAAAANPVLGPCNKCELHRPRPPRPFFPFICGSVADVPILATTDGAVTTDGYAIVVCTHGSACAPDLSISLFFCPTTRRWTVCHLDHLSPPADRGGTGASVRILAI